MQIIPAILSPSFEAVCSSLSKLEGLVTSVQIDVCDGEFGAVKTWIPNAKDTLPTSFSYEFDIMLKDWKITTAQCLLLNAKSVVMHVDDFVDVDIDMLITMVKPYNVALGIAVSNDQDLDFHVDMMHKILKLYDNVFIQVMGIRHIGQQGQPFDIITPTRVAFLKHMFKGIIIQVDGGVKVETIKLLRASGADNVVAGSSIFSKNNIQEAYNELKALSN